MSHAKVILKIYLKIRQTLKLDYFLQDPEGVEWKETKLPDNYKASCLSLTLRGSLWLLCHCGTILLRINITKETSNGTDWLMIKQEEKNFLNFIQITANETILLALDLQGQVYIRMGMNETCPVGKQWLKILKDLRHISLSLTSQVIKIAIYCSQHFYS